MRTMNEWLASDETGDVFSHCLCCKLPLVEIAEPWLVNKEIVRGECVLEYAICQPCRDRVTDRLSEESKAAVRNFLEREIDWEERMKEFMLSHDLTDRFCACISCGTSREMVDEFGISALFDSSGSIVEGPVPLLICRLFLTTMTSALSPESRKVWQDFLAENFTGPPGESGFPGFI